MWELFSTTLLVEVEVVILKYVSPLHLLKSSVRRSKRSPHARSLALPRQGGAKGTGAQHLREWSAEIRLLALRERDLLLLFSFLVSWPSSCMSPNRLQIKSPKSI
jgi:hypothetical protein